MTREEAIEIIRDIDKAYRTFTKTEIQALEMAIQALENEEEVYMRGYEQGRIDLFNAIGKAKAENEDLKKMSEQEPKTGHWILGICDNCGYDWGKDAPIASVPNFCPNCGAEMIESEE